MRFEKIGLKVEKNRIYKLIFFHQFWIVVSPLDRKSCEDHESPHFYGSTIISFRVTAILKSIFLDLCFFLKKNRISFFEFLGKLFFLNCVFFDKESNEINYLSELGLVFMLKASNHF